MYNTYASQEKLDENGISPSSSGQWIDEAAVDFAGGGACHSHFGV
jgi:hypothetical protein